MYYKKYPVRARIFIKRNKNAIILAAVTIPVIVLQNRGIKSLNEFLTEKGLFEEYYTPEV